ncbi:conserved hypothetical protein [Actinacidiphila cocklensis]|uniref:Uncharacterized protein n=1 Tax=Actinacidiphila cocklensis TaxID=887465 RepID=A0A9W4GR99_9ACTN|nr:conserved hypothetical protein [Actinacidiphila cocklensis]
MTVQANPASYPRREQPAMTNAKTLFPVCGRPARLPEYLVQEALRIAAPYGSADEADVERDLWCHLQVHGDGDHFALVLDLDGVATGAIWTRWAGGTPVAALDIRPDCSFIDPDSRDACCEFALHPGVHSHRLTAMPVASS